MVNRRAINAQGRDLLKKGYRTKSQLMESLGIQRNSKQGIAFDRVLPEPEHFINGIFFFSKEQAEAIVRDHASPSDKFKVVAMQFISCAFLPESYPRWRKS